MGRKNFIKGSNLTDRKFLNYDTDSFAAGVIRDAPATEIPENAIADGKNVVVYPKEIQGRLGSKLYTNTEIPPLTGKTGLIGSKLGYTITCNLPIFTQDDVGRYWVWPGTETYHEEIVQYIDGLRVNVADSSTRAATTGCYLRGKTNLWCFHSVLKKWLFLFGNELWVADIDILSMTKVLIISNEKPFDTVTIAAEYDDYSWVLFNANGHFHVTYYQSQAYAWKRNIPVPNIHISEQAETSLTVYKYNYIYSAARLTEQGFFINRLTPSRIELETGTVAYDENYEDWSEINTVLPIDATNGVVISSLYMPIVASTDPQEYQWHPTHYPIYRTMDVKNQYQDGLNPATLNDPQRFIWVKDLRCCAAFFARKYNGHILAMYGQFEEADIGSVVEWENGDRDTIIGYVAPDDVIIAHTYYGEESDYMACAIGNGMVYRASQVGSTVTRTHGDTFTAADVGKTITWSTGYRSIITDYVNANTVTVNDNQDRVAQGATCNPISRNFYDNTDDFILKARIRDLLCKNRLMEPMPNVNDGVILPGFMVTARRGEKEVYYCSWEDNYEYLASFFYKGYQYSTKIKDPIQKLLKCPSKFVALCQNNKTWHGPTNTVEYKTLPDVNIVYGIIAGIDILDNAIGCFDMGSIQEIDNGNFIFLTAEPGGVGLRRFNGFQYGPDELEIQSTGETTLKKAIELLQKATSSIYDAIMGYILWGRNKK